MRIPKLLRSSKNPQKVSLTFQGAVVLAIIYIGNQLGYDVSQSVALELAMTFLTILSGVATAYGIVRKIINGKLHG